MDVQAIEVLLDELGMPLPTRAAQTRATLDRLSVLDVSMQPEVTRATLASQLRGLVERGEEVDVVALVRANRANADHVEAAAVIQQAVVDAQRLHDLAFRSGGGLIPVVKTAVEEIYAKVRALPNNTPTTALEAVHADQKTQQAFVVLEELAAGHGQLRRLHRLLIADDVQQEVALVLFADTTRKPDAIPSRVQPAEAAGPREALARVRWLARSEAQAWVPTAAEINERYTAFLREVSQPMTGATKQP
jgi:hypothetical protein